MHLCVVLDFNIFKGKFWYLHSVSRWSLLYNKFSVFTIYSVIEVIGRKYEDICMYMYLYVLVLFCFLWKRKWTKFCMVFILRKCPNKKNIKTLEIFFFIFWNMYMQTNHCTILRHLHVLWEYNLNSCLIPDLCGNGNFIDKYTEPCFFPQCTCSVSMISAFREFISNMHVIHNIFQYLPSNKCFNGCSRCTLWI